MKYWRGYLVAAIAAAGAWGLRAFSEAHGSLVDMVYPYLTRMIQSFLADWSGSVGFCVWQVMLTVLVILALATAVMMIVFKWNPIQWLGWVLAAVCVIGLLDTGIYGLNQYAGDLSQDIYLKKAEYRYSADELEAAAVFYRDKANALADQITRDENGNVLFADFETLAQQAGGGFYTLTYEKHLSVFAGSRVPVKKLNADGLFISKTATGKTVALTGESAVNPKIPAVSLPFAMCHEMAHRMCIAIDRDADFAAFLACDANASPEFQYSAYFMAFVHCYEVMKAVGIGNGETAPERYESGIGNNLRHDLNSYYSFFGANAATDSQVFDLLVIWHIEKYVLPLQEDEEVLFDPKDEDSVDLSGIVNAKPKA